MRPSRSAPSLVLVLLWCGALVAAKDRIFVDQWSPTRSELFIADADGGNPRKLVAGAAIDYNASIMKADGSEQRALTDNRWEEGTPAWQPAPQKQ